MRNFRGGLLATVGLVALAVPRFDGEGDVGGGGGGGGAADLLDDTNPNPNPNPDPNPNPNPNPNPDPNPAAVPEWAKALSAEKAGEDPSNQEWVAKLGVKDLDGLAKIARDNQKALRESGRVKVPGENATDEERAAFREAMGAPKEAAAYEVTMPEGAETYELEMAFIDPLKEIAHKHSIPQAAFKELADKFLADALDHAKAEVARTDTEAADKVKEWGTAAPQRKEEFRRAAGFLGLNKGDIANIQREFGAGRTLELFAKIGGLMGEDFFASGDPAQRFGVPNLEAAQKLVDSFINNPEKAAKIQAGNKDEIAAYNRAVEGLAAWRESASKKKR